MTRRILPWVGFALFAASLGVYAVGASHSPFLDSKTDEMLRVLARGADIDMAAEAELAHAYWMRNPDVKADAVYGEGGRLGILGAREHYMKHGRREGRQWGP